MCCWIMCFSFCLATTNKAWRREKFRKTTETEELGEKYLTSPGCALPSAKPHSVPSIDSVQSAGAEIETHPAEHSTLPIRSLGGYGTAEEPRVQYSAATSLSHRPGTQLDLDTSYKQTII
jgi:hypothetical protein